MRTRDLAHWDESKLRPVDRSGGPYAGWKDCTSAAEHPPHEWSDGGRTFMCIGVSKDRAAHAPGLLAGR